MVRINLILRKKVIRQRRLQKEETDNNIEMIQIDGICRLKLE